MAVFLYSHSRLFQRTGETDLQPGWQARPIDGIRHQFTHRDHFIACISPVVLLRVAQPPAAVRRDNTRQGRREPVRRQHVLRSDRLDGRKLVLGRDVPHGNKLNPVRLAVGDVDEHRAKIPHSLAAGDHLLHFIFLLIVHIRIGGVEDESHVGTVEEVLAPKHGGVLVEQG